MGQASARWLKRAAVAGVAALGTGFVYLGKKGVELASDLEEVQNVVDVTFGAEGAGKIDAFAKKALSSFGITELEAKKFNGTLGALMKGRRDLRRGPYNHEPEPYRPLRRYGVVP